jgi:hypothetical protein
MKLTTKNLSVPTKEITIEGFNETITIYPVGGFGLMSLQEYADALAKDPNNTSIQESIVRLALKWGCKCEEEDIQYLIDNDLFACLELSKAVIEYSAEYTAEKMKTSSLAKKKLKK